MEDIRLKTARWEFAGREWELKCNMNVLADVQAIYGELASAFAGGMMRSMLDFLAAMLNDHAESQGWQVRYTGRQLGHDLTYEEFKAIQETVMDLVSSAVTHTDRADAEDAEDAESEEEPKN